MACYPTSALVQQDLETQGPSLASICFVITHFACLFNLGWQHLLSPCIASLLVSASGHVKAVFAPRLPVQSLGRVTAAGEEPCRVLMLLLSLLSQLAPRISSGRVEASSCTPGRPTTGPAHAPTAWPWASAQPWRTASWCASTAPRASATSSSFTSWVPGWGPDSLVFLLVWVSEPDNCRGTF